MPFGVGATGWNWRGVFVEKGVEGFAKVLMRFFHSMKFIVACMLLLVLVFMLGLGRVAVAGVVAKERVTLITFDVDGTLIHGSSAKAEHSKHANAFAYAVGKFIGGEQQLHLRIPTPLTAIPSDRYHGATDGLIALKLINSLYKKKDVKHEELQQIFRLMYEFYSSHSDEDAIEGTNVLPGVIEKLMILANERKNGKLMVGLVTGNVEGIARKKMRATKIYDTGIFTCKAADQHFDGENHHTFLGGFGSDYCSFDIDDKSRLYKDRAEQIHIAYQRSLSLLSMNQEISRIIHVGDAPSDVLAIKHLYDEKKLPPTVCISCIAVATGKYSSNELHSLIGDPVQNKWDPHVLEKGIADDRFIDICTCSN